MNLYRVLSNKPKYVKIGLGDYQVNAQSLPHLFAHLSHKTKVPTRILRKDYYAGRIMITYA